MCLCSKMQYYIYFLCFKKQLHKVRITYVTLYKNKHEKTKFHLAFSFVKTILLYEQQQQNDKRRIHSPLPSLIENSLKLSWGVK